MLRESPPSQFDNPAFEGADDQVLFDKTAIGNVGGRRLPFTRKHVILVLLAIGVFALLFGNIWAGWGTWNKAAVAPGTVFPTANPLDGSTVYTHGISQVTLDGGLFIALNWKIDQTSVNFTLSWNANVSDSNQRWYLLGFADREKLQGSDFCLYNDGKVTDGYITSEGTLKRDLQQDCELISSSNGSVTFRRRFSTCDVRDYAFDRGTVHFIFASGNGTSFPETLPPSTAFRQAWPLRKFNAAIAFAETDIQNLTFGAADATVPETEKSAWCTISKTELTHKHHIIRAEPAISLGNEELVRSIQLTHCSYAGKDDISYNGPCDKLAPGIGAICDKHLIASWTHGAPALDYPPAAGFPIGGNDGPVFLLSRVTYVNPSKLSGLSDNSTLILTVTNQLRPNDAGVFAVGSNGNLAVPKSGSVTVSGVCHEKCTDAALPEYGITVFASMLESTGNAISVEVLRKDGSTVAIDSDEHSTTHVPIVFPTSSLINIHKGDTITAFCKLSPDSDLPPICGAHLFYYPAMPLTTCKTTIANETVSSWLKDHTITSLADAATPDLQELYTSAPVDASCLNVDDNFIMGANSDWLNLPKSKTFSPLISKRPAGWLCPSIST
uniref:DOMON domain-containing protein n=1 Tax=Panagrellus redivivus TaxID=6233 RepID=A0A7E4W8I6_PANRE